MDLQNCKQNLQNTLLLNPELKGQISSLTQKAWGSEQSSCYDQMGWLGKAFEYVKNIDLKQQPVTGAIDTGIVWTTGDIQSTGRSTVVTTTPNKQNFFPDNWNEGLTLWWYVVWGVLLGIILIKFLDYFFEFLYDVLNAHRSVFLQVTLPRGDDKISREQWKDVAKDMKEKISRMGQVFDALHKLGQSSFVESIMRKIFHKPKVTFILHYEKWLLRFLVSVYPEYRNIVESGIAAQFPDASIEFVAKKPNFFGKKHNSITVMATKKNSVFPIKTYKQMPDDPLNNIIDTMGKMSSEDTFSIIIPIKPIWEKFNKNAQKRARWLYRREKFYVQWWGNIIKKILLFPWTLVQFLISGSTKRKWPDWQVLEEWGKDMVRMTKAEEEALNIMGEEAGKHAFSTWIFLISSSDEIDRPESNLDNMVSVFTIYRDEFNNELDNNEFITDALGGLFKPLWRFAANFQLPHFFSRKNVTTPNVLTSLFHYPDGIYNRSPIIKWLDYKMLASPDNLPELKEPTDYILTGTIAEEYLWWNISKLFENEKHWAVWEKEVEEDVFSDFTEGQSIPTWWEIVIKDWIKKIKTTKKTIKKGLRVFKDGVLLWINVHRNEYIPVYMKKKDRSRHHYIIWKSGWGKSVFIDSLARQDIWNWDGCCVIDPHGDLVESILQYIPRERARDVIYFDAGNEERPMWLNLYDISSVDQADRVVNDATEMFLKMFWPEIFWPRIQEYFKFGSLTLLEDLEDPATLLDVPRLFTDDVFREQKTKNLKNPVVRNFWEKTYQAMGDREKQEIIPYFTSKFVSFNTNSLIRNIIGQTKSAFDFRQVMDEGKILLVNLSKGKIGELNAQLLGMILVANIYNAAMSRGDVEEDQRRDFFLYVDEFQNFVTNTFADILSEARKYHLSLIMAHQYIAQLDWWGSNNIWETAGGKKSVKDAVFGNVWTMQSFKIWAPDAEFLEKEYAPVLSAQDIVGISNYKVYCKLNINNATSRVFSMNTLWTQDYKSSKTATILQEYSAKKYWRKREYVEAETKARLGIFDEDEMPSDTWEENGKETTNNSSESWVIESDDTSEKSSPTEEASESTTLTDKILNLQENDAIQESKPDKEKPLNNTTVASSPDSSWSDPLSTTSEKTNEI